MASDLAAVLEEGERLLDRERFHSDDELAGYFWQHGPRLLKIAREAEDLLDNQTCSCFGRGLPCARCEISWGLLRDALEGREENDGKPR